MLDIVITGGRIVDGTGTLPYHADIGIAGDRIVAIGQLSQANAHRRLSATGLTVIPGLIDTHVHGDLALFADPLHEPAIRQGVTTYIIGQDGVAMAPGSAETIRYMRGYTAGFSGTWQIPQQWQSMAEYLQLFEQTTAINVACLVPNGNLRMEAMGLETRPPTEAEMSCMQTMLQKAMDEGGIGLSSGMDYIPSSYAKVEELVTLCRALQPYYGTYVTHMWSYAPQTVLGSLDLVFQIGREANIPIHISHFNSRADIVLPKIDEGLAQGLEITFDLYCYLAGNTILAMIALPAWVQEGGISATLLRLQDTDVRQRLRTEMTQRKIPLEDVRLSFIQASEFQHWGGRLLGDIADEEKKSPMEIVCDVLVASDMVASCIVPHIGRDESDIIALMRHPAMMGGSDGIFTGNHPHPRGYGCYARYLGYHVRDTKAWDLPTAVQTLAAFPATRFGLFDRGLLRPGMAADIAVFDAATITDHATYENGKQLATGMHHVLVNGTIVLENGQRTAALPGKALRHTKSR